MNLETNYLGLTLKNPLIVSSCRLSESIDNLKAMEKAGAAAVVMHSIFEEEIKYNDAFLDYFMQYGSESFSEALTYFPNIGNQKSFLDGHLFHLSKAVESVDIPIIGSLNAITSEGWLDYAVKMQDTGISALELNLYHLPTKAESAETIEKQYLDIVKELKGAINIPLAVKLSPFFTSIYDMALKLDKMTGIDGLVLFNRFYYPDVDIDKLDYKTDIQLSNSYEARLPLIWIALLKNRVKVSIAGSTGVHTCKDVIKYLLAGADAVMCASCLMKNQIGYLGILLSGLNDWLKCKNFNSIDDIKGLLCKKLVSNPQELVRAQYMHALRSFKLENE